MEIYFFMRGSAQDIVSMYHKMIGFSMVPPYYALGFFQASNQYNTQTQVSSMLSKYQNLYIPVEGVMLESYTAAPGQVFTVNTASFPSFPAFSQSLNANNQHIIMGIDSGVANDPTFEFYSSLVTDYSCAV